MGMWVFVHTFPEGSRPHPTAVLGNGAVVSVVKGRTGGEDHASHRRKRRSQDHERGYPARSRQDAGRRRVSMQVPPAGLTLAGQQGEGTGAKSLRVLVPDAVYADTKEHTKFGVEGVSLVLKPGVTIQAAHVSKKFDAASFNPAHTKYVARSEKAKGMAVNMYSGFWSLVVCLSVTILVSLFTKPKPEAELKDLVFGLTKIPAERGRPVVRQPEALGGGRAHRADRHQHHLLVRKE